MRRGLLFPALLAVCSSAAVAGTFSMTDSTDNDSKERSIRALQLSEESPAELSMLELICEGGDFRLRLTYHQMPVADWMAIQIDDDHMDGADTVVFSKEEHTDDLVYFGDPRTLLAGVSDDHKLAFTAYMPGRSRIATFSMAGLSKVMARVDQACPRRG